MPFIFYYKILSGSPSFADDDKIVTNFKLTVTVTQAAMSPRVRLHLLNSHFYAVANLLLGLRADTIRSLCQW
jgi:hypothetical protein